MHLVSVRLLLGFSKLEYECSFYQVSLRICIISVFRETVLKCMFKYLKNYQRNKLKTIRRLAESTDLNFIDSKIKCNIR